jgi:hypothetical protein
MTDFPAIEKLIKRSETVVAIARAEESERGRDVQQARAEYEQACRLEAQLVGARHAYQTVDLKLAACQRDLARWRTGAPER